MTTRHVSAFVPVFVRSANNYDMDLVSAETGLKCLDPSLTQQQFAEEADINVIVDRFMKTGVLPDPVSFPQYADYDGIFDFQSALNVVRAADEAFMTMPARVRSRFHNSPQEFLEFFADPENREEGIRLGLVVPQPVKPSEAPQGPQEGPKGAATDTPSKA